MPQKDTAKPMTIGKRLLCLYDEEFMQSVMKQLNVAVIPIPATKEGGVTAEDGLAILNWRAHQEFKNLPENYQVNRVILRSRVKYGNLHRHLIARRMSLFPYVEIFHLRIAPRRGVSRRAGARR